MAEFFLDHGQEPDVAKGTLLSGVCADVLAFVGTYRFVLPRLMGESI